MVCASLSRQERQAEECPYRGDDIILHRFGKEPRRQISLKSGFLPRTSFSHSWGLLTHTIWFRCMYV